MSESGQPRSMSVPAPRFPALVPVVPAAPAAPRGLGMAFFLVLPALAVAAASSNPGTSTAAVLSVALIVRLLWLPGHPPVLLFAAGLQWLQAALMTFDANVRGLELREMTYARGIDEAAYLSLLWATSLALGAWLVVRKLSPDRIAATTTVSISMQRLLMVYGGWALAVQAFGQLASGGLYQVLIALTGMRSALCFAIFAYGWSNLVTRPIAIIVLLVEVAFGFMSFFSQFRVPLYLFIIALATTGYRPRLRTWFGLAIMFGITLYLTVLWSAIKMDYRDRLSGGEGARTQVVRIDMEERIESFVELVGTVDTSVLGKGFDKMLSRVAYIEYLSYVIDYVPAAVDHEGGKIWGSALTHVLVPRMFFPDKAPLEDDTVVAERYTGLRLGAGSGTSISIGTVADSYVDFGRPGVPAFGFAFGILLGLAYRHFIVRRSWGVLAQGMAVAVVLPFTTLELAASKALGGYLSLFLISVVSWRLVAPPLMRWLARADATR